ncbi:MAG: hypothetical protein KF680_02760 [Cryobacterium sp.]|nr:hypothetical protein [Cryobacterium sp.]
MATESTHPGVGAQLVRVVASAAMIGIGLFLVLGNTPEGVADGIFVGSISIALAIWLWPGASTGQARVVSIVLVLLAAYAFVRGFGLLELSLLRQLGGIAAIVMGVILLLPVARLWLAQRSTSTQ